MDTSGMGALMPYLAMMGMGQGVGQAASGLQGKPQQQQPGGSMLSMLLPLLMKGAGGGGSGGMESQMGSSGGLGALMQNWQGS